MTTTYAYDALNRLTSKTFNDGSTPTVNYSYDQTACLGQPACFNSGRRTGMTKTKSHAMTDRKVANELYQEANKRWRRKRVREAFRFFLAAAKAGSDAAFETLAQFYDYGQGTRTDRQAALYWYRRAYRHGIDSAANNIGCIWRDRGKLNRAIWWLKRAVKLGDDDANLNIAKVYLRRRRNLAKAEEYLNKVRKSKRVTAGSKEEARQLLKTLGFAR